LLDTVTSVGLEKNCFEFYYFNICAGSQYRVYYINLHFANIQLHFRW